MRVIIMTVLLIAFARPASAQLFEISSTSDPTNTGSFGNGAYDPVHDCYFIVAQTQTPEFSYQLTGRFLSRSGAILGTLTLDALASGWHPSAVTYSADISDGAGGFGGFVVVWASGQGLVAQRVGFPGRLVGSRAAIALPAFSPTKLGIAYSPVQHVFLVVIGYITGFVDSSTEAFRLNTEMLLLGKTSLAQETTDECSSEFVTSCNQVGIEWNSSSGEFGVLYNDAGQKTLARVLPSGAIAGRTPLGLPPLYGALAVDASTGSYLAVSGGRGSFASSSSPIEGAEVSASGVVLGRGVISSQFETANTEGAVQTLSYSPASGTFLLLGRDRESYRSRALELNPHGVPLNTMLLPSHPSAVASHPTAPEWMVAEYHVNTTLGTRTRFGGSGETPTGCVTPDPFTALGGGTCYNGGWLPPGIPVPAPPTTVPGGCIPPDPFAALGGGTCVNGGWLPPGMLSPGTPPPASPPAPDGCATPDPFVALGGGTCVNGGWLPPGMLSPGTPPPTSPPAPDGCATPDPFVALGGGTCVNGGWLPPGMSPPPPAVPGGCTTPDPFVAIGGGVCVDGGWRPRG